MSGVHRSFYVPISDVINYLTPCLLATDSKALNYFLIDSGKTMLKEKFYGGSSQKLTRAEMFKCFPGCGLCL